MNAKPQYSFHRRSLGATAIFALTLAPTLFGSAPAKAQVAPATPVQAPAPRAVRLPRLAARPNYIIGRAVFEDGRPIPNFEASAESGFAGLGKVEGHNGQYAIHVTDPNVYIVQNIKARIKVQYDGQTYLLPLHPVDNLPDAPSSNAFRGDVKKGVVRDFVFHLSGIKPGYQASSLRDIDTSGDFVNQSGFEGGPTTIDFENYPDGSTFVLTLTPDGPLMDGTPGKVIQRTIPNLQSVHSYAILNIPLGKYTATGNIVGPNGDARPLKIKMKVYGTPIGSGSTPLPSVPVSWPFDSHLQLLGEPRLTFYP